MRIFLLASVLTAAPGMLHSQTVLAPHPTAAECDSAVASLSSGDRTGNWGVVYLCGEPGASAVASAIRTARSDSDSAFLQRLWSAANMIRHPLVLAASREVAVDQAATTPARIVALMVMLAQYNNSFSFPMRRTWTQIVTVPAGQSCFAPLEGELYGYSMNLPASYLVDIASTAEAVSADVATPPVVRDISRCIRQVLKPKVPDARQPGPFTVTYVCGNTFRIHNAGAYASGSYLVENTTESGDLGLPENGSIDVTTVAVGSFVLTAAGYSGDPTPNGGTPCP